MVAHLPPEALLAGADPLIRVAVRATRGSAPREGDALMLVSRAGVAGTIGGGRLEEMAIERARAMLAGEESQDVLSVPLGPEIGQCCGGAVTLGLDRLNDLARSELAAELDAERLARPQVYVFGAGHVGRALTRCLLLLPVRPVLIDSRADELAAAPAEAETRLLALPESALAKAPAGSAVVVLTHDHALDFLIASQALAARRFAYVGMIGSRTKRALFVRSLAGGTVDDAALVCPIGGAAVRDKRPEIIAALTAAEIAARLFGAAPAGA